MAQDIDEQKQNKGEDRQEAEAKPLKKDKRPSAADISAITARLETAEKAAEGAKEQMLRTAAEYDNFRKRSAREKDSAFNDGVSHTVEAMLTVIDTLELACGVETQDAEYKKGVIMTLSKCEQVLKSLGVDEIEALDTQFDPELHSAVMQQESDKDSGTVVSVFQKGYKLGDKVIRHSSVAVAT